MHSGLETFLFRRSRDPVFLWKMVIAILVAGVLSAWVVTTLHPPTRAAPIVEFSPSLFGEEPPPEPQADPDLLAPVLLAMREAPFERALEMITWTSPQLSTLQAARLQAAIDAELPAEQATIATSLLRSLRGSGDEPEPTLQARAATEPPVRYANFALGQFYLARQRLNPAAEAFEREGRFPEAASARQQAVWLYRMLEDAEALKRLEADPAYAELFNGPERLELAARRGEWWDLFRMIPAMEYARIQPRNAALAGFAGAIWLVFLLQAGQVRGPHSGGFWLCLLGVAAGVFSIWPTVFAIYWQEHAWGLSESAELGPGLAYYIAGVGLREEVCKLLLFMPLVPILLKRGNELEMLIVAGCVGLGFAAEENIGYFNIASGESVGRFLTANFFHIVLTGLLGLAVCRAIRWPREHLNELPVVFVTVVGVHGVYDALLSLPDLIEYGMFAITVYILLSYQFFGLLRALRGPGREIISLTATFLFGLASLVAITYAYLTFDYGMKAAADLMVFQLAGVVLIVFMFLREVPEPVG